MKRKQIVRKTLLILIIEVIILLSIRAYGSFVIISGVSMEPSLHDKEIIFMQNYYGQTINREDIITFSLAVDEERSYIKRVIGLPGDQIEFKDGAIYINGALYEDKYGCGETLMGNKTVTVPENCYYVMGDNRNLSKDSRLWIIPYKFIKKDQITKILRQ